MPPVTINVDDSDTATQDESDDDFLRSAQPVSRSQKRHDPLQSTQTEPLAEPVFPFPPGLPRSGRPTVLAKSNHPASTSKAWSAPASSHGAGPSRQPPQQPSTASHATQSQPGTMDLVLSLRTGRSNPSVSSHQPAPRASISPSLAGARDLLSRQISQSPSLGGAQPPEFRWTTNQAPETSREPTLEQEAGGDRFRPDADPTADAYQDMVNAIKYRNELGADIDSEEPAFNEWGSGRGSHKPSTRTVSRGGRSKRSAAPPVDLPEGSQGAIKNILATFGKRVVSEYAIIEPTLIVSVTD